MSSSVDLDVIEFPDDESLLEAYQQPDRAPGNPASDALLEIVRRSLL
jgi:hypothetical protein